MGITMKFTQILPLVAASSAFVLPSQEQLQDIAVEANHHGQELYDDALQEKDELLESFKQHYENVEDTTKSAWGDFYKSSKSVIDDAFDYASETADGLKDKAYDTSSQVESWLRTEGDELYDSFDDHHLAGEPKPQRVAFKIGLNGLTVNFYSRIVAINFFGTNGVIHGVDSIIVPPPKVVKIVDLFPGEFSTLELGLTKTGLLDEVNSTDHAGGTLFAPSNFAL